MKKITIGSLKRKNLISSLLFFIHFTGENIYSGLTENAQNAHLAKREREREREKIFQLQYLSIN